MVASLHCTNELNELTSVRGVFNLGTYAPAKLDHYRNRDKTRTIR